MGEVVKLDTFKHRQLKRSLHAARADEERLRVEAATAADFVDALESYFETGSAPSWPPVLRATH